MTILINLHKYGINRKNIFSESKSVIELKVNKKSFKWDEYINFKEKLEKYEIEIDVNKSSEFLVVQLPTRYIFFIEFKNKKIVFHVKFIDFQLIDASYFSLNEILERINNEIDPKDKWSIFIRIKDSYLVRKGDVKGYDFNTNELLLCSISHKPIKKWLKLGRTYKKSLFENIKDITQNILLIKSVDKIEYIINPLDIRCIISSNKLMKIFIENYEFVSMIEVKLTSSFKKIKDFLNDETQLNHGIFIKLNRSTIFNLLFFERVNIINNLYYDLICDEIKVTKKVLLELEKK